MIADLGEPLVYEHAREGWFTRPEPYRQAFMTWMREHGIDPNDTISVAVHVIDAPFARVEQHVMGEDGKVLVDRERERLVTRTVTVPLTTLPPTCEEGESQHG